MKKFLPVLLCLLLIVSCPISAFADTICEDNSTQPIRPLPVIGEIEALRGTNIPSTTVPLYSGVSSNGSGSFYYGVYSNYKYSDHGGSIKIQYTNTCEDSSSTHMMTINLYTGNALTQRFVDSITVSVNSSGSYTFTGLDSNKSYYFWFYQGNYEFETTTAFSVSRGN